MKLNNIVLKIVLIITTLTLSACRNDEKVTQLESQISLLQKESAALKEDVLAIKSRHWIEDYLNNLDGTVYLTPGSTNYLLLKFDLGVLTVSLENIQPYANGSKITLLFGNPLSSRIDGLGGTFEWGKVDEKGLELAEFKKSKEISFDQPLYPGAFTKVSVILEGVPPTDFGYLRLKKFTHKGIHLSVR